MQPSIGRIVHYQLSAQDADAINHGRRGNPKAFGNPAAAGQICAATVVRVFENNAHGAANLQVHLDGTDTYWATSRIEGTEPGTWSWPPRT